MSEELVAFLRARIADDERIARRACEYAEAEWRLDEEFGETVLWWPPEPRVAEKEREHGLTVVSDQWRGQTIESGGGRIAPHIARHDPARVLERVRLSRNLLRRYEAARKSLAMSRMPAVDMARMEGRVAGLETAVRNAGEEYADHPDYREEWRP